MTWFADRVTNVPVPFQRLRMKDADGVLQEGVVGAGDLKVTPRGAGANPTVDIGAGAAWIFIDTGTRNGLVHVFNDAVANVAVSPAHATNPRVDYVTVRYNDSSIPTGTGNTPTPEVLAGTATAGAQATNPVGAGYLSGAPALGNDRLLIGALTVPAAATSIVAANILDRRPWARGAYYRAQRTAGNVATTSSTLTLVDAANLNPRIECSGAPVRFTAHVDWWSSVASKQVRFDLFQDGASAGFASFDTSSAVAATQNRAELVWEFTPSAGSHTYGLAVASVDNVTTITVGAVTTEPLIFSIEELVRPVASNT